MINILENLDITQFEGIIIPLFEDKCLLEKYDIPLESIIEKKLFIGKSGSLYNFSILEGNKVKNLLLVGLGKSSESTYRNLLKSFTVAVREMNKKQCKDVFIDLTHLKINDNIVKAASESTILGVYNFDNYLKKEDDNIETKISILIKDSSKYYQIVSEAEILAKSNIIARGLVNEPSNIMTPGKLAKEVIKIGAESGFEVEVLNKKEIEDLNMHSFLAVANGSDTQPKFIIMKYMGEPKNSEILGLVGKGLTYDSGGLSIKPTASMVDMKSDMAGSAAVIGAMSAISESKLKKNVIAVVAACENMISGSSYRPGDILNSMGGKTIFIGNTDAEGRLTLIDAMHYIITKELVTKVVDIATLTGAAIHCTGDAAAPVISNNDDFFNLLNDSYTKSGEQLWRMPIFDEYKELIKHEDADLTNTAGSPGTITAGLFIGEFTNNIPWIHIDIAGPSMAKKDNGFLSKGGTGCGVKPLYYLAKNI
ncbi:MAG: leucyl aminopeptidase [Spirochaetaceae bacterium]